MNLKSTFGKHATLGALIAATGLPASMAQAQFRVEYSDSNKSTPQAASADRNEKSVIVIQSHDDTHKYEVKLVNGDIAFAELDGHELKKDRVKLKGEMIIFLSEDGKTLHELKAPGVAQWTQGKPAQIAWVTQSGDNDNKNNQFFIEANAQQPKVMLGINLSEPSDAMRKQLKLGSDQRVILVEKVIDGLPAKKAGLEDFDVILSIDGSDFADGELLGKVLHKKEAGDELKLVVLRGGDKMKIAAKLAPYNAEKLGMANVTVNVAPTTGDFEFPMPNQNFGAFGKDLNFVPELHEKLMGALKASGLSEEEIERVQAQLHEHIGELGQYFNSKDGAFGFRIAPDHPDHPAPHANEEQLIEIERHHAEMQEKLHAQAQRQQEFAAVARDKARQAMREVERQVMEMRDGRLIVRNAEQMEGELAQLEARLNDIEARLDAQMSRFESQMDRIADMFDRLMDRLEVDED